MQEFQDKRMMGHAFRRCGFKIKSNGREWQKNAVFCTTFFIDP